MVALSRARVAAALLTLSGCGPKPVERSAAGPDRFQHLLDSTLSQAPQVPGLILRVESPKLAEPWTGAVGYADRAAKTPLEPTNSVRIASQTKTFVAVSILRLMEQGKLGLDTAIARYLSPESIRELRRGGYDPSRITVRQVLHHTSGIFDYGMTREYLHAIEADPGHRWSRLEQVKFAIDHGKKWGEPDESYHYSDTGYVLLGEIIERLHGKPLGQSVRDLVDFDRVGLRHTYFETLDSVPPGTGPRAHQYADTVDTYRLDASHDLWGGGGIVSDVADIARFYRTLVRGEILSKATTEMMLVVTPQSETGPESHPGSGYGMGIGRGRIGSLVCYGHGGYWGTLARYGPSAVVTVVAAMNRTPDSAYTLGKLINAAVLLAAGDSAAVR
jgi:D-alanyl-D-alanine carboxypeptidase